MSLPRDEATRVRGQIDDRASEVLGFEVAGNQLVRCAHLTN